MAENCFVLCSAKTLAMGDWFRYAAHHVHITA